MPLWPSNFAQFGGPHVRPLGTSGWNISFDVHWGQLVHSWHCVQEFWRKTRFFNEIGHFRHFYHFCLNEGCDTPTLKIRDSHRTTSGVNLRVPLPHTNPITSFDSWHPILLWPGALSDTGQSIVDQCMASMFVPAQSLVFDRFSKANGWTDGRTDRRTDGRTDWPTDRRIDG